ncbi:hypothetical protein LZ30DRAFT_784749 [Colletotrichum cereale]|nr:hypothetical protein LZ30DRAFT_784749 [Colletotrichum cereale]
MSNNGAERASYEGLPLIGSKIVDHVGEDYDDNRFDNIGRANGFLVGLTHPSTYKGLSVTPLRGRSWAWFLAGASVPGVDGEAAEMGTHDTQYAVGFEVAGPGAMSDPGEVDDLSAQEPVTKKELLDLWKESNKEAGVVGVTGDDEFRSTPDAGNMSTNTASVTFAL